MNVKQLLFFILIILNTPVAVGQDSVLYLSKDDVVSIVKKYHPIVKQAAVRVDRMSATVTMNRGNFDPSISAENRRKTFDGRQYYNYLNPELSIPTWYGIDIKAGVEEVYGSRVSPETTLGKSSYAGVNMSVLNGLLFDERRATLRKAIAYRDMSEVEQRLVENNVILEALNKYWQWVNAYNTYKLYSAVVRVNKDRLSFLKLDYEQGNIAAIDTTEALTQLQTFQLSANEAWVEFQNTGLDLSSYLWLENGMPFEWLENIQPDTTSLAERLLLEDVPSLESLVSQAYTNHPKLNVFEYKIKALEIDRKLKQQEFLPQVDLKFNLLNKGYGVPDDLSYNFLENNYAAGINFKMPLLFRKAYGGYRAANFKIQETLLDQSYTQRKLENDVKMYYTEVLNLYKQIDLYEDAYENFHKMYRAEMTRYRIGESSLFLINLRENRLLLAEQKLLSLKTKWHIKYSYLLWSTGVL